MNRICTEGEQERMTGGWAGDVRRMSRRGLQEGEQERMTGEWAGEDDRRMSRRCKEDEQERMSGEWIGEEPPTVHQTPGQRVQLLSPGQLEHLEWRGGGLGGWQGYKTIKTAFGKTLYFQCLSLQWPGSQDVLQQHINIRLPPGVDGPGNYW